MRTTDGGTDWSSISFEGDVDLYAIQLQSNTHAVMVGAGGAIYTTANINQTGSNPTWTAQTSHTTKNLRGVTYVPGSNIIYAVGDGGAIVKGTLSGSTWTWVVQTSHTTNTLYGVSFADSSNGWAVGANGTVLQTTNGGSTWSVLTYITGLGKQTLYAIQTVEYTIRFTTYLIGVIVGAGGTVLAYDTTRGRGAGWNLQTSPQINDLFALNFYHALNAATVTAEAAGASASILYSTNSGAQWNPENIRFSGNYGGVQRTNFSTLFRFLHLTAPLFVDDPQILTFTFPTSDTFHVAWKHQITHSTDVTLGIMDSQGVAAVDSMRLAVNFKITAANTWTNTAGSGVETRTDPAGFKLNMRIKLANGSYNNDSDWDATITVTAEHLGFYYGAGKDYSNTIFINNMPGSAPNAFDTGAPTEPRTLADYRAKYVYTEYSQMFTGDSGASPPSWAFPRWRAGETWRMAT